jgi:VIT1/CCC1 family predicted Fe2+/Mn2+ transporter
MALDPRTVDVYRQHLRDEADSAFLYRVLAGAEPDSERKEIYLRLADVEDKHTAVWVKILSDGGAVPGTRHPSLRARVLAWTARRFGPGMLASLLLREEGREVKGYLALHRSSPPGSAHTAALRLARESAEHAETLRSLDGGAGEPWHQASSGGVLRNVVYGFNDGLTANFGLVAGVLGAAVAPHVVLLSGASGMIADALSMASSGYLAAKSEREVYDHEIAMEAAEITLMPEVEAEELALVYEAKGVERAAARRIAAEVMADPDRALKEKVREELGIGDQTTTPWQEAWVTGLATAVGAFIPVAPFFVLSGRAAIGTAFAVAMLSHFAVGAARSLFTGRGIVRSGIDMFAVGLGVAGVGYLVGALIAGAL